MTGFLTSLPTYVFLYGNGILKPIGTREASVNKVEVWVCRFRILTIFVGQSIHYLQTYSFICTATFIRKNSYMKSYTLNRIDPFSVKEG